MRGKQAKKRSAKPDYLYNSQLVSKLINYVMQDGKKIIAQRNVYDAMKIAGETLKADPLETLEKAIDTIKPRTEVKSRRVGGANYQVPTPVEGSRQTTLAFRWLIKASREARGSMSFSQSLAAQIVAAIKKEGAAYKKREDVEKMAEANKAFAHFQW